MNYKKILVSFLVVIAWLGYIGSSGYLLFRAIEILENGKLPVDYLKQINPSLMYVTTALTGLVGGIVAMAFGVKLPKVIKPKTDQKSKKEKILSLQNINYQRLGSFIKPKAANSRATALEDNDPLNPINANQENSESNSRGLFGFLYAIAYILMGIAAVFIWISKGDQTMQAVSHMATSFLGMLIAIVLGFFNNSNQ